MIEQITASDARPIRHTVLRPGQPAHCLIYPGDDNPETLHLGARIATGDLVATVSLYRELIPGTMAPAWRIRGMATRAEFRSRGFGGLLLRACLEHVQKTQPGVVWCNARTTAAGFYRLHDFEQRGSIFEIADIGPHVIMMRSVGI